MTVRHTKDRKLHLVYLEETWTGVSTRRWRMFEDWPTKVEVSRETGLSQRTIERKIQAGDIRQEFKHIPGRKPISILHPEDVAKLKEHTLVPIPLVGAPRPSTPQPDMSSFISLLSAVPARTRNSEKLYLRLDEAAEYSGLSKTYLRRQIASGVIHAFKDGGWRIKRADLESMTTTPTVSSLQN
jgi:excisionase family DNA binding protein